MSSVRPRVGVEWDAVAARYAERVGDDGSSQHRRVTIPATLGLLALRSGERVLDIGAGTGPLAPAVARSGACYTGVDASPALLAAARRRHGRHGRFVLADARSLAKAPLEASSFDAAVFLLSIQDMDPLADVLSIQDMDPLADVLSGLAWALRGGGRVVIVMTHPCFRVPRLSGWGWDDRRRQHYRRVDRYLTPLPVPAPIAGVGSVATVRYHRPLQEYVNGLAAQGFLVDCLREISHDADRVGDGDGRAERQAHREFPVFLGLRARKGAPGPAAPANRRDG